MPYHGSRRRMIDGVLQKQCPVCERWFVLGDWPLTSTGIMKDTCSRECSRIKARAYYRQNPDVQRDATQRWRAKNRAHVNAVAREWHRKRRAAVADETRAAAAERRRRKRQDRLDRIAREGKVCPRCGEHKPADQFGWSNYSQDYESHCRSCRSRDNWQAYRRKHPAKYPGRKGGRPAMEIPIPVGETYVTAQGGEREIMADDGTTLDVKVINKFGETIAVEHRKRTTIREAIKRGDWTPSGEQYYTDPDEPGHGIRVLSTSHGTVRYRVTTPTQPTGAGVVYHIRRAEFDRLVKIGHWVPA